MICRGESGDGRMVAIVSFFFLIFFYVANCNLLYTHNYLEFYREFLQLNHVYPCILLSETNFSNSYIVTLYACLYVIQRSIIRLLWVLILWLGKKPGILQRLWPSALDMRIQAIYLYIRKGLERRIVLTICSQELVNLERAASLIILYGFLKVEFQNGKR